METGRRNQMEGSIEISPASLSGDLVVPNAPEGLAPRFCCRRLNTVQSKTD